MMALEIKASLKLSQSLVMTPQLQQAIKLLQLNRHEMQQMINQELVENPLLEEVGAEIEELEKTDLEDKELEGPSSAESMQPSSENKLVEGKADDIDWEEYMESFTSSPPLPNTKSAPEELPNFENMVSKEMNLVDHLMWQAGTSGMTLKEMELCRHIVGNLNEDGHFMGSLEDITQELSFDIEDAQEVLKMIQKFDPVGVASRDLRECLLNQIGVTEENEDSLLVDVISNHLDNLENRNYQAIIKATGHSLEDIYTITKQILQLNPKPGREFTSMANTQYIVPDIYVAKVGDEYTITLNEEGLPNLRVSSYYRKVLKQTRLEAKSKGDNSKEYIQEKLRSAVWLIKSIHNRQKTIYRVMESIVDYQRDFFDRGIQHLRPMVLREVANDVGVHESTISRVTTNKYAHTPMGIFELKFFFNSGIPSTRSGTDISSESVRQKIRKMIESENSMKPLSDKKLSDLLKEEDIQVARRTIAKYRESLSILSSTRRKKLF